VDLKQLSCKKLFQFFIQKEPCLKTIFYALMTINILIGLFYIVFGFYIGIENVYSSNIVIGAVLLTGLWDVIFTLLGVHGILKRKKDFINYYSIGLALSIFFTLAIILIHFVVVSGEDVHPKEFDSLRTTFVFVIIPLSSVYEAVVLFFSCMFHKIYNDDYSGLVV